MKTLQRVFTKIFSLNSKNLRVAILNKTRYEWLLFAILFLTASHIAAYSDVDSVYALDYLGGVGIVDRPHG